MKLTTLKPKINQAPSRIAMLTQRAGATPRMRGRAAVERRERWLLENPLCIDCKGEGRVVAGDEVDHEVPLWNGGADDESNFSTRCREHHAEKTAREAAERARTGLR